MKNKLLKIFALIGALAALCAALLLLKKKLGFKCKKCAADGEPETVEDFVEEAVKDEPKPEEAPAEEVKPDAAAIAEEFKDYADVEPEKPAEAAE